MNVKKKMYVSFNCIPQSKYFVGIKTCCNGEGNATTYKLSSYLVNKKKKSSETNFTAERHWAVLIPNERQCMVPLTSQGIYRESQLVWLLNPLSQIKSVPERETGEGGRWRQQKRGYQKCHLHRSPQNLTSRSRSDT